MSSDPVARAAAALAEAGYPNADIRKPARGKLKWVNHPPVTMHLNAVWWMACHLATKQSTCWSCYGTRASEECARGNCAHPDGPAAPPRSLLTPASGTRRPR
jgi:7-cyano-7-deazaguanine synthase in queuosine biosynthesis